MEDGVLQKARNFAQPLLEGSAFDSGEDVLAHADAMVEMLDQMGDSQDMQAACYLVYACDHLNKPAEVIAAGFGQGQAELALETTKLVKLQRQARLAQSPGHRSDDRAAQTETVRKMLLAFSRDLRVVMLRLASRLQTLRYYAAARLQPDVAMAHESLQVFAPLANRLGIWQIKWELEDLSFRFLQPEHYRRIAKFLDEKRVQREQGVQAFALRLRELLQRAQIDAEVQGRPKHIYSIVKKMRGKALNEVSCNTADETTRSNDPSAKSVRSPFCCE